jgi:hypothetical protein
MLSQHQNFTTTLANAGFPLLILELVPQFSALAVVPTSTPNRLMVQSWAPKYTDYLMMKLH